VNHQILNYINIDPDFETLKEDAVEIKKKPKKRKATKKKKTTKKNDDIKVAAKTTP